MKPRRVDLYTKIKACYCRVHLHAHAQCLKIIGFTVQ